MKAVIEFENVDVETGEVMRSQATALASMTEQGGCVRGWTQDTLYDDFLE